MKNFDLLIWNVVIVMILALFLIPILPAVFADNVTCNDGYLLNQATQTCELMQPKPVANPINAKIDEYAGKISKSLNTSNLIVGYLVIAIGFVIALNYLFNYLKVKK